MLRRLIAVAVASALGISFYPTDSSARRTRAAVAHGVPSWTNRKLPRRSLDCIRPNAQGKND
ncbi:MAG: hypothetical protein WCD60_20600 [Pseudolabrys sp.]